MTGSMIILCDPKEMQESIIGTILNSTSLPGRMPLILLEAISQYLNKEPVAIELSMLPLDLKSLTCLMTSLNKEELKKDLDISLSLPTSLKRLTFLEPWRDGELPQQQSYLKFRNKKVSR